MSQHDPHAARLLRRVALLIAVVGLALAAFVYVRAGDGGVDADGNYQIVGGQAYAVDESHAQQAQTERMGGHALVMTAQFSRWLGSLWHGQRLAWTLGSLSLLVALVCLWVAGLVAEDVGE